ncbi:MAG: hypothetical protein HUU47_02285 [Bacteroidetes bacterium]|nr:hypothetical protein [Bacteroidota bacterium]
MKNKLLLVLLAALFFASCSRTDEQVSLNNDNEGNSSELFYKKGCKNYKEIKGILTYNYSSAASNSCGEGYTSTGNYTGSGKVSHLGKVTSTTVGCYGAILDESYNWIGVNILGGQETTFKMPNGDLIYLSNDPYELYFIDNGVVSGEAKFYFNGGTGKYSNAQGSFTCDVVNYLFEGKFTVDLEGYLKY